MLSIDFEAPRQAVCGRCGNATVQLTRFVYQDDKAYAVYYAAFTPTHADKVVSVLVGLGEWGDDTKGPESRVAFALEMRVAAGRYQVGLIDAAGSPWAHVSFLGGILDRAEARRHPLAGDVFHLTDHIVAEDRKITGYFEQGAA